MSAFTRDQSFEQGVAIVPPGLFNTKQLTVLCDAAMYAFSALVDMERAAKSAAEASLAAALADVDTVGLSANRLTALAEEYRPTEPFGWSPEDYIPSGDVIG